MSDERVYVYYSIEKRALLVVSVFFYVQPFLFLCCCNSLRLIVIEKSPLFSALAYFPFTFNGKIDSILQRERERERILFLKIFVRHQTRNSRFYDKQHYPNGFFLSENHLSNWFNFVTVPQWKIRSGIPAPFDHSACYENALFSCK